MNILEKEFTLYEEALALKELGFDEPCMSSRDMNNGEGLIQLPLYQQAFRWFRDKHKLSGLVQRDITRNYNGWWFKILSQIEEKDNPIILYSEDFNKDTYEEAELACLQKLIQTVKK